MKTWLLCALWFLPGAALAVDRDLGDCVVEVSPPPSANNPLDLDNCDFDNGDDITGILSDLATTYGSVYVRAPSRTANVVAAYTAFTVNDFYFYEDEDGRNTLSIQHKAVNPATCSGADCRGFWTLWLFQNFNTVQIGGPLLSITFQGNHPGFANCSTHYAPAIEVGYNADSATICDINYGLLHFKISDSSLADLADVRANVRFSQMYAIVTEGNQVAGGATTNAIEQVNIAGSFYATSGMQLISGVRHVWSDPDRTVLDDPFLRITGWQGEVSSGATQDGSQLVCRDQTEDQLRISSVRPMFFASQTGGWTVRHGGGGYVPRNPGSIGTAESPLTIRIQNLGMTGPGTGVAAGLKGRIGGEALWFKGDPAGYLGFHPSRFIRLIMLPTDYASQGVSTNSTSGCPEDAGNTGYSNFFRFENSEGSTTEGYYVEWAGDWRTPAQGGKFTRGQLINFAWDDQRSWKNTVHAASGTEILDTLIMVDTNTVTGPGTFGTLRIADCSVSTCSGNTTLQGQANTITDTNVSGSVTIDADTENTTVANVNFTGTARAVITIAANSDATVTDLCVPDGSTITGAGTLTYEGSIESLPFNIPSSTANCSITADGRPNPPSGGSVN